MRSNSVELKIALDFEFDGERRIIKARKGFIVSRRPQRASRPGFASYVHNQSLLQETARQTYTKDNTKKTI